MSIGLLVCWLVAAGPSAAATSYLLGSLDKWESFAGSVGAAPGSAKAPPRLYKAPYGCVGGGWGGGGGRGMLCLPGDRTAARQGPCHSHDTQGTMRVGLCRWWSRRRETRARQLPPGAVCAPAPSPPTAAPALTAPAPLCTKPMPPLPPMSALIPPALSHQHTNAKRPAPPRPAHPCPPRPPPTPTPIPRYAAIPVRPIMLDTASSCLDYPSLEHRLRKAEKKSMLSSLFSWRR